MRSSIPENPWKSRNIGVDIPSDFCSAFSRWRCAIEDHRDGKGRKHHTIESLRLDLKSAAEGKTWLLLPKGYRHKEAGSIYPLPGRRSDIHKLAAITIPPTNKMDSGCVYLRRALKNWRAREVRRQSAILDMARRENKIVDKQGNFMRTVEQYRQEVRNAVDEAKEEAAKAIASLGDLFDLGKEGIEGQMKAHLAGEEWQGEKISASAFREAFRIVTQAVKGLGLPSKDKPSAENTVNKEMAESLRGLREAVELAGPEAVPPPKTEQ